LPRREKTVKLVLFNLIYGIIKIFIPSMHMSQVFAEMPGFPSVIVAYAFAEIVIYLTMLKFWEMAE